VLQILYEPNQLGLSSFIFYLPPRKLSVDFFQIYGNLNLKSFQKHYQFLSSPKLSGGNRDQRTLEDADVKPPRALLPPLEAFHCDTPQSQTIRED
jgi:hypothetical protein